MTASSKRPFPELLAPASSVEIARVAFDYGADAVYAGASRYTLRAQSPGLEAAQVRELHACAREQTRRLYLALNAMPSTAQLRDIERYVARLAESGALPDAFIVSDAGVLRVCRRLAPATALHLSTQSGACNAEALAFWATQGISRVVLPRELSIAEIHELSHNDTCETEVFVHGAMCVAVSGRCLLSAYLDGRHANRGDCAQPCRERYRITRLGDGTHSIDAGEDAQGTYLLNARDLCALPVLPHLLAAGVSAIKIEGRTKSAHYVAAVTGVYREALDACRQSPGSYTVREEWMAELRRHEHREYTTGFYGGELRMQSVHTGKQAAGARLTGIVKARCRDGSVVVDVRNSFSAGDELLRLSAPGAGGCVRVRIVELCDMDGVAIPLATANRVVSLRSDVPLRVGDMLRVAQ